MSSGIFNVGAYQVAGHPYLTGSTISAGQQHAYFFPSIAKRVVVQINDANSGSLRVHLVNSNANNNVITNNHYWTVFQTSNLRNMLDLNFKCDEIYISGQNGTVPYQVFAELTSVPATDMYPLSGSGIDK